MKKFNIKSLIAAFLLTNHAYAALNVVQISTDTTDTSNVVYALTSKGKILPVTNVDNEPPLNLPQFIKIESGSGFALGLTTSGEVVSWNGLNIPLEVRSGVIDIASSWEGNFGDRNWALKSNGTVVHWANNQPTEIFNRPNVKSISFCRNKIAVGLQQDGTVIGLRTGTPLNISNVKKIACGSWTRWYLLNDGNVATINDNNQVIFANSPVNGNVIDLGVTITRLFVLKSNGTVVAGDANSGGIVEQPDQRYTKNIKALNGQFALRKDGTIVSMFDAENNSIRSYFKRETHDLVGSRKDQALWRPSNDWRLWSTVFNGRGIGLNRTEIGWVGATNWQIVGKGNLSGSSFGRIGYIAKNQLNNRYYYNNKSFGSLLISENFGWSMGQFNPPTQMELVGDINGDGVDEIVWRNTQTGSTSIGFYQGSTPVYRNIGSYANNVRFEGITDFDDNGYADILFRNTNDGNTMILHLDQTVMTASPTRTWKSISTIHKNLNIVALADLNMDGIDDIVVQNPVSGRVMVARMTRNLNVSLNWTDVITIAPPVKLINVGDYDGDGFKDLLWHNPSSGNVAVTYIENYLPVATHTEGSVPTNFAPVK